MARCVSSLTFSLKVIECRPAGTTLMSNELDNAKLASSLIDQGRYREALAVASRLADPSVRAAILIDAGSGAKKTGAIREGISLLSDILASRKGLKKNNILSHLCYNIANGYHAIYQLKRERRAKVIPPNDDDLRATKKYYRKAIASLSNEPNSLRSRLFVNYANCLSQLGRGIESLAYYKRALEEEKSNGMASGNLGLGLYRIAQITGRYYYDYLFLAHEALQAALGPYMHLDYGDPRAIEGFKEALSKLQDRKDARKDNIETTASQAPSDSKEPTDHYVAFCLQKQLFLNAWTGESRFTPAFTDEISYGPITTKFDDDETVPELIRILNEIKEAFATARYLFYLSLGQSSTADEISKLTLYFGTSREELNGLYIGLSKSAYLRAFDVLDKVARIVNVYYRIGRRNDHFWHLFAERQSRGQEHECRFAARPSIVSEDNYSLYALSDLCIDYFESEHVDLKSIDVRRNLITHDYLTVLPSQSRDAADPSTVSANELFEQVYAVLQLAKNATLYAVSAITLSEAKKAPSRSVPIIYGRHPGTTFDMLRL